VSPLSVATFNVHAGVDGWGRPYDVVEACRELDADVLLLQEVWTPYDEEGVAERVAAGLGYHVTCVPTAKVRLYPPVGSAPSSWGPLDRARPGVGVRVEARRQRRARARQGASGGAPGPRRSVGQRGTIGLALLTRVPTGPVEVLDLGKMPGDGVTRSALRTVLGEGRAPLTVTGTHMSHLRNGSPIQIRRLARLLPEKNRPGLLMGDMNLWGPPLSLLLPGWHRAVRGRTWPSWRRLFQIDHVMVTEAVTVLEGAVVRVGRSDHLPLRVVLD
jgi:endonuclease/exonuclease/phosphatase family metal-dependent hydrolase